MHEPPLPPPNNNDDHDLLHELADLTGLFNPENIWKEEEQLDALDEQQASKADESRPAAE